MSSAVQTEQAPLSLGHAVGVGLLVVVLLFQYEIVRPVAEAVFLEHHGTPRLPYAWLTVAAGAAFVALALSGPSSRWPLLRLLGVHAVTSALCLGGLAWLSALDGPAASTASFVLYVVKDIYVVVLLESFWMYANASCPPAQARKLFGLFCAAGSLGSAMGARTMRTLVSHANWSALETLGPAVGALLLAALYAWWLESKVGARVASRRDEAKQPWWAGVSEIKQFGVLRWLLVLVLVTQLLTNLLDFRFYRVLELNFSQSEARAAAASQVYEWISYGALFTQLVTGPVLAFVGLGRMVVLLPWVVGSGVLGLVLLPGLATASIAKAGNKIMDYGWFRATKELLYHAVPSGPRVRGKALIDIFGYRGAKAGASFLVLVFVAMQWDRGVDIALVTLLGLWMLASFRLLMHHRRARAAAQEEAPAQVAEPAQAPGEAAES